MKVSRCILCNEGAVECIVNFGKTPLANEFSSYGDCQDDDLFDLNFVRCVKCGHTQLDTIVDPERLYRDYLYVSGTSDVNRQHFIDYASDIQQRFNLCQGQLVIDIGSNDGILISALKRSNIDVLGIDPARNIAMNAEVATIPEFFNVELAQKLANGTYNLCQRIENKSQRGISGKKMPLAKVICCNNMFAHNQNLDTIVKGVLELLDIEGVFIFENSYLLDIVENNLFDTLYHEHCHTHSITPLIRFFRKFGMKIFDVKRLPHQQGGSIRVFVCRNSDNRKIEQIVFDMLEEEKTIPEKLKLFATNIDRAKIKFQECIGQYKEKTIHCYGYAAKTTTLFYKFGIEKNQIKCCYEDAPLKQGRFSPGLHIPIVPTNEIYDRKPDVIIVSAWNFAKNIIAKHQKFVKEYNGIFIVPLPECKIISKDNIDEYIDI